MSYDKFTWEWKNELLDLDREGLMPKRFHTSPVFTDEDGWVCGLCGAESFDKDLFNEVGEELDCVVQGTAAGLISDEVMAAVEVQQAKKWIGEFKPKKTVEEFNSAAKELERALKSFGDMTNSVAVSMKPSVTKPLVNSSIKHYEEANRAMRIHHDRTARQRMKGGR